MIKYRWTRIWDIEQNSFFSMSPRFGFVYKYKKDFHPIALFIIGSSNSAFCKDLKTSDIISDLSIGTPFRVNSISKIMMALANTLPLNIALKLVLHIANYLRIPYIEESEALSVAHQYFGIHDGKNCLPLAICRFALLKKMNFSPKLCIGNLIPTDISHAWIELGSAVKFENADFVANFQKMIEFYCEN